MDNEKFESVTISCKQYGKGIGLYCEKDSAVAIAASVKENIANGYACRIDMSDIDTATTEFLNTLAGSIYDGEYDFAWLDENIVVWFGHGEMADYYRSSYRRIVSASKSRYNKENGIIAATATDKVTVAVRDIVKMENFTQSWQAKPVYDKVVQLLFKGRSVRIDFSRTGQMNMTFLNALLCGFYTDADVSFDEIKFRLSLRWNDRSKKHDKALFAEFKDMMAAYQRRLRQIAEVHERKAMGANRLEAALKPTASKDTEETVDTRKKSGGRRNGSWYDEEEEDWRGNWR